MRSVAEMSLVHLLIFQFVVAQAHEEKNVLNDTARLQNIVDNLVDNLAERVLTTSVSPWADLDTAVLQKARHLTIAHGEVGHLTVPPGTSIRSIHHGWQEPLSKNEAFGKHFSNAAELMKHTRGSLVISRTFLDSAFGTSIEAAFEADTQPATLAVCTNKACRKTRSFDTLALLRALASTHSGIASINSGNSLTSDMTAGDIQEKFAQERIQETGCLDHCGMGPNVVSSASKEILRGVKAPEQGAAFLRGIMGLDIPEAAVKAYVKLADSKHIMRVARTMPGKKNEALHLLDEALEVAGGLHVGGAFLLRLLFEERAAVHESLGDVKAAQQDRNCAAHMMELRYPAAECVDVCLLLEHQIGQHACSPLLFGTSPCAAFCGLPPTRTAI